MHILVCVAINTTIDNPYNTTLLWGDWACAPPRLHVIEEMVDIMTETQK